MKTDRATLTEADPSPAAPVGHQAISGSASTDDRDPASRKHHAAALARLGDIGVALAEELPPLARAQARLAEAVTECLRRARPEGVAALGELAVTLHRGNVDFARMYERICRSVRRCIAMQIYGASSPPRRSNPAAGARDAATARPNAAGENADAAGRNPTSEAESGIAAEIASELRPERLFDDLYDRPEDPTGMADLGLDRPPEEIIAQICADFGVDGRLWAERLGFGEQMPSSQMPAAGNSRSSRRSGRQDPRGRRADKVRGEAPMTTEPPVSPNPAPLLTADHQIRRPPDRSLEIGSGSRNRRERRAALKLARRSSRPATRQQPENSRGPP